VLVFFDGIVVGANTDLRAVRRGPRGASDLRLVAEKG